MKKVKIARVVTIPFVFIPIINLLEAMDRDERIQLYIVCSNGEFLNELKQRLPNTKFQIIAISREIHLLKDLIALAYLIKFLKQEKIDILHSHTPKAGLLSAMAGFLCRVPHRIHTYTGQVWATMKGFKKLLLINLDRLIYTLNTINLVDSNGQRKFLIKSRVGKINKLQVLGNGSFGGYDVGKFNRIRIEEEIQRERSNLFPNFSGTIISFLGRINEEKGIKELYLTFVELKKLYDVKLLLVGPMDKGSTKEFFSIIEKIEHDKDVVYVDFTNTPELYLGIGDIFCFPSYREGCANVVFEASLMEVPVVVSKIYGTEDAYVDNVTGLEFRTRDIKQMQAKIEYLILNKDKRISFGKAGRERVVKDFSDDNLTKIMIDFYLNIEKRKNDICNWK